MNRKDTIEATVFFFFSSVIALIIFVAAQGLGFHPNVFAYGYGVIVIPIAFIPAYLIAQIIDKFLKAQDSYGVIVFFFLIGGIILGLSYYGIAFVGFNGYNYALGLGGGAFAYIIAFGLTIAADEMLDS